MNSFVSAMLTEDSLTENGALTHSTSSNFVLDLFFLAGACRNVDEQDIINVIVKAYNQDRLKTLKTIFWAGDIRQGAGERRFFKLALKWLSENHPEDIQNNYELIPYFSRWDIIFDLAMENQILFSYIVKTLSDPKSEGFGLLCKWLPRKVMACDKTKKNDQIYRKKRLLYKGIAAKIMEALKLTPKQYRKILVEGSNTEEQKMCSKLWNEIDYSKVPSVALNKYNKAWYRNDLERFTKYLEDVDSGKNKINASVIFPHDILGKFTTYTDMKLNKAKITQWNNLPNYLTGVNSIIPLCDVSGSMNGLPLSISVSLGLYISERNKGPFENAFITFSQTPQLQYLSGNINERIKQLIKTDWDCNTNFVAAFELILEKAQKYKLSQEELPKTILAISDMEFDEATDGNERYTNFDLINKKFQEAGYKLPNIIFWNVNGRPGNVPIKYNTKGVALVSGASPSILKAVLTNDIDPIKIMDSVIETERYSKIK